MPAPALYWRPETPVELRHAALSHSDASVRAAVAVGLLGWLLPDVPADPAFPAVGAYWMLDSWEWFPLPDNTIAAIQRHLVASAH